MLLYPQLLNYIKHIFTFNGMFEFRDVTRINDGGGGAMFEPVTQSPLQSPISAAVQLDLYLRRLPIRRTACSFFSITKTENEYVNTRIYFLMLFCNGPLVPPRGQSVHPPRPFLGFHVVAPLVKYGDA